MDSVNNIVHWQWRGFNNEAAIVMKKIIEKKNEGILAYITGKTRHIKITGRPLEKTRLKHKKAVLQFPGIPQHCTAQAT